MHQPPAPRNISFASISVPCFASARMPSTTARPRLSLPWGVVLHLVDPVGGDLHLPSAFSSSTSSRSCWNTSRNAWFWSRGRTCRRVVRGCARENARERVEASPERVDGTRADARRPSVRGAGRLARSRLPGRSGRPGRRAGARIHDSQPDHPPPYLLIVSHGVFRACVVAGARLQWRGDNASG